MPSLYRVFVTLTAGMVFVVAAPTLSSSIPRVADTGDRALAPPSYVDLCTVAECGMDAGMRHFAIPVHDKLQPFFHKHTAKPWAHYVQKAIDIGNTGIALGVGGVLGASLGALANAYSGAKYGYNRLRQRLGYRSAGVGYSAQNSVGTGGPSL